MQNLLDHRLQNKEIESSIKESIESIFPIKSNGKVLQISNIVIEDALSDTDFAAQKEIKIKRKTWENVIKADAYIIDEASGRVISEKQGIKIGAIPKLTNRFSAVVEGNEYQVMNQVRRKSGVFSRVRKNGELESEFNLEKGQNFSLELDPQAQIFYFILSSGTRRYRLYTLLSNLDMDENEMIRAWGDKLFEINKKGALNTETSEITSLYEKLVAKNTNIPYSEIRKGLKAYFEGTVMSSEVNELTIGGAYNKADSAALLASSIKLLKINKGEAEPDNRDSLIFKNLYSTDDLLKEYFKAHKPVIQAKLKNSLTNRELVREVVSADIFTRPIRSFFTTSDLSSTPPQTNPVSMVVNARKTTSMGEGGIQNMHSITMETRDVQPSFLGFIDSLSTPEGGKIGVNQGLGSEVVKYKNQMATPVFMPDGSLEYKTPLQMHKATVGFPDQFSLVEGKPKARTKFVKAIREGIPVEVEQKDVTFWLRSPQTMFDFGSNLVPFLQNTQANRGAMAGRMITQALSLDSPEAPLVRVKRDDKTTYNQLLGSYLLPHLYLETGDKKLGGVVQKVDKDYVYVKTDDGKDHKVGLYRDFPLNQDGFLNSEPLVKAGDRVKGDQILAKSNYSDEEGNLALGKNLTVAYISYKGNSFEDGAVITRSAAQKLSHSTIDRLTASFNPKDSVFDKKKFRALFPEELSPKNFDKLNADGLPKVGTRFEPGEVVAAFLIKKDLDNLDLALKKLNKAIYTPYSKVTIVWEEEDPGEVIEVAKEGRNLDVYVKSSHPFKEGDKLSGLYGDKHIVSKIIPDDESLHRPDGTPVEIMVNPQGVQGRMNMGQILEAAAGKIAIKTGKPYFIKNFDNPDEDMAKKIYDELNLHGLPANERLRDGKNGDYIKNEIFVGNRTYLKLRHLVKKKQAATSYGVYDIDEQPAGKGAQKIGVLDTYVYIGHGAKNLLREASEIKGRKNEEYFRNLQFGMPPARPNSNAVFDKMINYLRVAGADVQKDGHKLQMLPLTDAKTLELSSGALKDPGAMLIGKNLGSRKGGLFDPDITGGMSGEKFAHIPLPVELPNPMTEFAIKSILGLNDKTFTAVMEGKQEIDGITGPKAIMEALNKLDVGKELSSAKEALKIAPPTNINKLNTKVRILEALESKGMNPKDAYSMKNVLVIPPRFRPIYPLPSGDLQVSDINKHYRDVGLKSKGLENALKENLLTAEESLTYQNSLYYSVKALQGFVDPVTYGKQKYKGSLKEMGDTKRGLIFGKAWAKRQDLSGRSTIVGDPTLDLDQVGLPKGIAQEIFKPFMVRKMVQSGMPASKALKEVNEMTPYAERIMLQVMEEKPVVLNRAPSLHKHSIQSFVPQLTSGKEIRINPLIVSGFGADFDGDTMSVMTPVTYEGEQDARSMFPSKILFKHGDNNLVPGLSQEYVFGVSKLSEIGQATGKTFKSIDAAKESKIDWTHTFILDGKTMTVGQYELNKVLPDKYKDYTRTFKRKDLSKFLSTLAKEEPSDVFSDVINHYKNLGALYAYKHGGTVSLTDMILDRSYRDDIIKTEKPRIDKIKDPNKKAEEWVKVIDKITIAQDDKIRGNNNMYELIETGALSATKAGNIRQVLTAPGVVTDTQGRVIPIPILRSYSEGLDTFSYFNTFPGARKGSVDRAVNTQESGALNKELLAVTRRLLVTETDCGTTEGIAYEIDNKNAMDRYALETVPGVVKRNELIDGDVILKAKQKKIASLTVRSPLTCEVVDGVCQKCYGLMPGGNPPTIGTNVGVLESQALTERATQLTLSSFHTGGAASSKKNVAASFPRLEQLLKLPETLSGKATLSPVDGRITYLQKNEIGGWDIHVNTSKLTIEPGRDPVVELNDVVKKGDRLSDGAIKPQELSKFKTHLDAQRYITNEISSVYDGAFHDKSFETVVRGISDNAIVTEAPDDSGIYRGDKKTMSYLKHLNKERSSMDLPLIKFDPYFKSIETLNVDNEDWMTRLTTNRVKDGIQKGVAKMQWANISGKDPIPAYIYGDDFGLPSKKDSKKGFY